MHMSVRQRAGDQAQDRDADAGAATRRPRKLKRRILLVIGALILVGVVAFGGLLLVTPSVGNARALARAQDLAHHAAYPGPPVPPRFAASIEATEDHRFSYEPGIDPFAIARVAASWLTGGGTADQGGATIYQQLAKLLYTSGQSSTTDELEQVSLAVKLYMTYSSEQILRMYADVAYFGDGDYGLAAASCGYFAVPPDQLSWPQAALLAGLVQGPTQDDPLRHPGQARVREVHVVGRLVATGEITQQQGNAALTQPISSLVAKAGQAAGTRCAA
jgi:membrane peptidoglycan carboxypeptidase